jgi:hypothetical protein
MDHQRSTDNRRHLTADDYASMARATDELLRINSSDRHAAIKALGDHYRAIAEQLTAQVKA